MRVAMNVGVEALLSWVNSIKQTNKEATLKVEDLQDGEVLLQVVYMLRKQPHLCSNNCTEDRFKIIADFVERDCRFSAVNGTTLSWDNIRNGINLTIEMSKVLLLLVYHDMMNDRCTLNTLDCEVEREIANLTGSYVMESNGYVHLSSGLDAYLARRYLPVSHEMFERGSTTSASSVSSDFSSDEQSPVFTRTQKVTFVDIQTVASSSASSPLQEIMNTPKFQLRKMQRQMIKERDYRDGLERELASKLTIITQRESHINQLQYCLDKLKEEQTQREQVGREQIDELETKNNMLQLRFNELLKENKVLKGDTSLMERKVDELAEENGVLSSQMRGVCSQLAIFEAEVDRLTKTQATAQEEWSGKTSHLQSELNEATTQKELLTEQIQILQGKISCLEDELRKATKEEEGENMWPAMEKEMLENEINSLRNELENTFGSLKMAEVEIQAKSQQLEEYQQEVSQQKDLLMEQKAQMDQKIQAKDEILDALRKDIAEQRALLQQEIHDLKCKLEQAEHEKTEQMTRLQQHIVACEQEIEMLKEIKKGKEELLHQTEEKVRDLETKLSAASSLLADKDQQVIRLKEEVDFLADVSRKTKDEIQAKEENFAKLLLEKSQKEEVLQNNIQTLTVQVEDLGSSLKQAEQEFQLKQEVLAKTQQENTEQKEVLHQQILACEEKIQGLNMEIEVKNEQLVTLENDHSRQSEILQEEIRGLKGQMESLNKSLTEAKDEVKAQQAALTRQEEDNSHQKDLLQQQLSASEETVRTLKEEIKAKVEQMSLLKNQSSEQLDSLQEEIRGLQQQVECLHSQLINAKENLESKENLFAKEQQQSNQHVEELQAQIVGLQDEVRRLNAEILCKEEQLFQLKEETSAASELLKAECGKQSEILQNDIQNLTDKVQSLSKSLNTAAEQLQITEDLLAKKDLEISHEKDAFQTLMATTDKEICGLKDQIQAKEEQLVKLKEEASMHSDQQKQEIQCLKTQLENKIDSLTKAEEKVQIQVVLLTKQEEESAQQLELLQQQLSTSEEAVRSLKEEIQTKVEQMSLLKNQSSEQSDLLQEEIGDLKHQVEVLHSQLTNAEESLESKENLFAKEQQQSNQHVEELQVQIVGLQDEVKRLNAQILTKEEKLLQLNEETSAQSALLKAESLRQSEMLQNDIQSLNNKVQSLSEALITTEEQLQTKDNLLAKKELEISQEKEVYQNMMATTDKEISTLKEQIQAKEEEVVTVKAEASVHSDQQTREIQCLKTQLENKIDSLKKAEEKVQSQVILLTKQEEESAEKIELLQQQLLASETEIRKMKEEIHAKEQQMTLLKTFNLEQSDLLHQEIESLKRQVDALGSSLREAEKAVQSKEGLLTQQQQENDHQREVLNSLQEKVQQGDILQKEVSSCKEEIQMLKESLGKKESLLIKAEERLQTLQTDLSTANIIMAEKDQNLSTLREEATAQANLVQKTLEEAQNSGKMLAKVQEESSKQTGVLHHCIEDLKGQVESISLQLKAKEELLLKTRQESAKQMDLLQQQLISVNAELNGHKETQAAALRQKEAIQVVTLREKEALVQEREVLMARILQAEDRCKGLEKQLEATVFEKDRLVQAKQAIERENVVSQKLESMLQKEVDTLKTERQMLIKEREGIEMVKSDLQEQLSAKSEAAEHYKAQMEKAVNHYNGKKELLQETQEQVVQLKHSLEHKERKVKAITMESKVLQMNLDKAKTNEKILLTRLASLEAQLAFADQTLRAQNKIHGNGVGYLETASAHSSVQTRAQAQRCMSSDSLDQSSLEDSLNTTRKLSLPDESSTPLVRSSERLAAKRRGLKAESLETLYFTPINIRHTNRTNTDKQELDSVRKNPSSSVKRRRTTQVINITMTKKTPGTCEADETFYSLPSARSQPNLSSTHSAQPVSVELFDTPARGPVSEADQLIGLPGYRRSTAHSQTTSTFCVGTENEPEGAPDDWMRIAEIQARNKACLPHLKSSYPVEFDTGCKSAFLFTDEELRTGDPSETIRRVSMMPGQLQDSLTAHRLSFMVEQTGAAAAARSHRLSLMPGQLPSKTASSTHLRSPKDRKRASSMLSVPLTSPEKKVKASCFPRPLTPKNKNVNSGSNIHAALSPADRRQSMMFTIENTPKKDNYLKKGLNKLRSSTRKSPGSTLKKSPAQMTVHKGQENKPSANTRTGTGRAGRIGSHKSPQVTTKGLRKSPQVTSRTAKSPGLTSSARKGQVS
ncbi:nuclear mitotic apparatus protein 1 isoform X2 [Sphaeramia orbicularis]|nr:nuclear mitotic apparatus protein 1 isoform X2 [Sphaeramia orbicularis]